MEKKTYIEKVIHKIEQSISEKIKIEQLSNECFVSPRQLYRDFYSYTGHSIYEYIRKRRLSKALSLLKHSHMSISDIAYVCGYSSQQAFCKSVKESTCMTPNEYRNHTNTYYYFPLYKEKKLRQIYIETKAIPQMIGIHFFHSQLSGIENRAVDYLAALLPSYSGKLFGRNGQQRGNQFCYQLYIEYSEKELKALEQSLCKEFFITPPYHTVFAYTTVKNNEQEINDAWEFLYGSWLKNSMYELDDIPYFEEYIRKDNRIKKLVLHLPVKPREHFHKINIDCFDDRLFIVSEKAGRYAEKTASHTVMNFIGENHSYLFQTQKEYYVSKKSNSCICGMNLKNPVYIPDDGSMNLLTVPKGLYAVLEGSCLGSGEEYEYVLLQWLAENGFEVTGTPFTIYDTSNGTGQNEILVKAQVRIKDGRII